MVACEEPRPPNGPSPIQASASSGDTSYGFTVKVLEGITVNINSISVGFKSPFFNANLQLSQLLLESTNPNWKRSDLKHTYIHDKNLDQVLTFKKVSWQTMRIVANALNTSENKFITPLRLITNHSEIMITFRRKASDCSIIASCLHIHFDDLLWVLTDSQVQSALLCMKALRDMMERSNQQMRKHNLQNQDNNVQQSPTPPQKQSKEDAKEEQYASKHFHDYLILETSFHVDFDNVDLHICEETNSDARSGIQGGAIQLSLRALKIDHYPYHKPASDRNHFRDYGEVMRERDSWASSIIKTFRSEFAMLREAARSCGNLIVSGQQKKSSRLVENCLNVRLTDIEIHQVTMDQRKNQGSGHLLHSTRNELHLPDYMLLFHFIHTKYYYPDGRDYPAPPDNAFMQINAPLLHAHWDTLIWLNQLTTMTVNAVQKMLEDLGISPNSEGDIHSSDLSNGVKAEDDALHADVRIQLLMPKIFVPGPITDDSCQPLGLEIQASKATVSNCREGFDCHRQQLCDTLDRIEQHHLARHPDMFPSDSSIDMPHLDKLLREHSLAANAAFNRSFNEKNVLLTRKSLIACAKDDVWSVNVENVWIDFIMPLPVDEKSKNKKLSGFLNPKDISSGAPYIVGEKAPFVDSFPAQIWIGKSTLCDASSRKITLPTKKNVVSHRSAPMEKCFSDDSLNASDVVTSNEDISSSSCDSPRVRNMRNRRLRDYYKSPEPAEKKMSEQKESVIESCDVITTYILLHTMQSIRLQVDHHQYLFVMKLPDMLEDIGKQLEASSKVANLSNPSTCPSSPDSTYRSLAMKSKPMETTSVRIDAPFADLFLILEPGNSGENTTCSNENPTCSSSENVSLLSESDIVPSVREATLQEITNKMQDQIEPSKKTHLGMQDSPIWSESNSESVSIQGSENNISVSEGSYTNDDVTTVTENMSSVRFVREPKSGVISSSPSNQSVLSEKSALSDESRPALPAESPLPSTVTPINKELLKIGKLKSGSSGYESSSCESIPIPENLRENSSSHHRQHSRESSNASDDQFVMIQVERKYASHSSSSTPVRFIQDEIHQSSIYGDTSSLSSQPVPTSNATPSQSESDSKEPSINEGDTKDHMRQKTKIEQSNSSRKAQQDLRSYSIVALHISNGVEIAVDSNDSDSSVVKLNALTVNVAELGSMERRKTDSIFDKYSAKKIQKLWAERSLEECGTESPNFRLRVDTGPLAGRFSALAAENGHIQLSASSISLNMKGSTLGSFGGFFEEDGPSKVTPMKIDVSDVELAIEGDTSAESKYSQPPEAITLHVDSANVNRTDDGIFHINSISVGKTEEACSVSKDLQKSSAVPEIPVSDELPLKEIDPNNLKFSNASKDSVSMKLTEDKNSSNGTVDSLQEENTAMKSIIESLQNDLRMMQSEKESLEKELCLLKERSSA